MELILEIDLKTVIFLLSIKKKSHMKLKLYKFSLMGMAYRPHFNDFISQEILI